MIGVIAHLDDINLAFEKLNLELKPSGYLIIQFTNSGHLISKFGFLKAKLFGGMDYKYKLNKTSLSVIEKMILNHGLRIEKRINYFPVFPLFSFFPKVKRKKAILKFHNKTFFSRFGSEVVLVLRKN